MKLQPDIFNPNTFVKHIYMQSFGQLPKVLLYNKKTKLTYEIIYLY